MYIYSLYMFHLMFERMPSRTHWYTFICLHEQIFPFGICRLSPAQHSFLVFFYFSRSQIGHDGTNSHESSTRNTANPPRNSQVVAIDHRVVHPREHDILCLRFLGNKKTDSSKNISPDFFSTNFVCLSYHHPPPPSKWP